MRILALDWGTVRIGAAISDPDGKIAFPLDKFLDAKHAEVEIKKIVDELQVEKILVGMPKNLAGEAGKSAEAAERFVQQLQALVACKFEWLDERFTSKQAGEALHEQGISEKKSKDVKDNISAQIMLQQYLDTQKIIK